MFGSSLSQWLAHVHMSGASLAAAAFSQGLNPENIFFSNARVSYIVIPSGLHTVLEDHGVPSPVTIVASSHVRCLFFAVEDVVARFPLSVVRQVCSRVLPLFPFFFFYSRAPVAKQSTRIT